MVERDTPSVGVRVAVGLSKSAAAWRPSNVEVVRAKEWITSA
jgi:hypothetical protein